MNKDDLDTLSAAWAAYSKQADIRNAETTGIKNDGVDAMLSSSLASMSVAKPEKVINSREASND